MPKQSTVDRLSSDRESALMAGLSKCSREVIDISSLRTLNDVAHEVQRRAHQVIRRRNTYYARAAMLECLQRGEAPFASHLLYTQVLDDDHQEERKLGMCAGLEITRSLLGGTCEHAFYVDLGMSSGMKAAFEAFKDKRATVSMRSLGDAAMKWYVDRVGPVLSRFDIEER